MAIKLTASEKAQLMAVKHELAIRLAACGADRDKILGRIGVRPNTYEAAFSRGSIKLSWILRILGEIDVSSGEFFALAFGYEGRPQPSGTPPKGIRVLHEREALGDFDDHR